MPADGGPVLGPRHRDIRCQGRPLTGRAPSMSAERAPAGMLRSRGCLVGLGEVVGAYLRHGAALDALDDHLATPVTAVGDRDASPRAELFQD